MYVYWADFGVCPMSRNIYVRKRVLVAGGILSEIFAIPFALEAQQRVLISSAMSR